MRPNDRHYNSCPQPNSVWLWSNVTDNFSQHFKSQSNIYFLPGVFRLNKNFTIELVLF